MDPALLTIRYHAQTQHAPVLSKICQGNIWRTLSDHEVYRNQTLEDNGPCRIAQPCLQYSEDLSHSRLTRVCRHKDMLNVLGLWRCGLLS